MGIAVDPLRPLLASLLVAWPIAARGLEAVPAWNGRFVPGEPTEVAVRLSSPVAGPVLVTVDGTGGRVERLVEAAGGHLPTVALPAYPGADGRLQVGARTAEGEGQSREVLLVPQPVPFPAAARRDPAPTADADGVAVPVRDLPGTPAGYGPVASLTLTTEALAGLDPGQAGALAGYLAGCGALTIPDASPELIDAVRAGAGCAGRAVAGGGASAARVPRLPATERLASELGATAESRQVVVLFLPYLLLLAGLVVAARRLGPWVIALPAGAAFAYAAALPLAVPGATSVSWAEAAVGDAHQRFATLVRAHGAGNEVAPIGLPAAAGLVTPTGGAGLVSLSERGELRLARPTELLRHQDYRVEGAGPVAFRLEAVPAADGEVAIRNAGDTTSPKGWVIKGNVAAPFPALRPGQMTGLGRPSEAAASPPTRIAGSATGILLPLSAPLPAGTGSHISGGGWLLVRLGDDLQ